MKNEDCYPYTNEEIRDITECVSKMLFKWLIADDERYNIRGKMMVAWSGDEMWKLWSLYGGKYHPLAQKKGLHKEMLTSAQKALVRTMIKQTLIRASDEYENGD